MMNEIIIYDESGEWTKNESAYKIVNEKPDTTFWKLIGMRRYKPDNVIEYYRKKDKNEINAPAANTV